MYTYMHMHTHTYTLQIPVHVQLTYSSIAVNNTQGKYTKHTIIVLIAEYTHQM